jgi:glucose-6-phosphate-specific signal transduction histidine kinase
MIWKEFIPITLGALIGLQSIQLLLVEVYPPSLQQAGLPAALRDLLEPLRARGISPPRSRSPTRSGVGRQTAEVVFRVAQEALRNVVAHSRTETVEVSAWLEDHWLVLTVAAATDPDVVLMDLSMDLSMPGMSGSRRLAICGP